MFPGTPSLPPTAPRRHLLRKPPTAGLRCCRVWASASGGISHLGKPETDPLEPSILPCSSNMLGRLWLGGNWLLLILISFDMSNLVCFYHANGRKQFASETVAMSRAKACQSANDSLKILDSHGKVTNPNVVWAIAKFKCPILLAWLDAKESECWDSLIQNNFLAIW